MIVRGVILVAHISDCDTDSSSMEDCKILYFGVASFLEGKNFCNFNM